MLRNLTSVALKKKKTKPKKFSLDTELIKLQYFFFLSLNEQTKDIYHPYFHYYLEGKQMFIYVQIIKNNYKWYMFPKGSFSFFNFEF